MCCEMKKVEHRCYGGLGDNHRVGRCQVPTFGGSPMYIEEEKQVTEENLHHLCMYGHLTFSLFFQKKLRTLLR